MNNKNESNLSDFTVPCLHKSKNAINTTGEMYNKISTCTVIYFAVISNIVHFCYITMWHFWHILVYLTM